MKLKSFNYLVGLLIIFLYSPVVSEEKIDIWNNKNKTETQKEKNIQEEKSDQKKLSISTSQTIEAIEKIQIQEGSELKSETQKVYGIFDPAVMRMRLS